MAFLVKLPPLGEGLFEAQMVKVHKKVGDVVKEGDVIAEMQTDKATGVLASPVNGTIKEFYVELRDYVFREEKVLLIDDGKEALTTGSGADGGRVNADGVIVAPPSDEKLAGTAPSLVAQVAEDKIEDKVEETIVEVNDTKQKPMFVEGEDYHVVKESGSAAEIFRRFYGEEEQPKPAAPAPNMEFLAQQGQAQQGEPKPAITRKHRYLDPLQDNFQHSLDGSQPIPTHIANQLSFDELMAKSESVKTAPALRKYAAERGLDLTLLPTDENGVITKDIIEEALSHAVGEREWNFRLVNEMDPGYWTHRPDEEVGREETYIRKYNTSRFEMTHHKVPPLAVTVDVDMTKLMTYVAIQKGDKIGAHPYMPYFIKAICLAAYRYPELNSTLDDVVSVFRFKQYVNVGIEMNMVKGLFTPVVKDAHLMDIPTIENRIDELEHEVKVERVFNYETNSDSTITISDLTEYGTVDAFVPVIHYPDAAIFGFTNIQDKAVVRDGQVVVRAMKPMTLVVDARIVTRDKAVRVANFVKDMIEEPSFLFEMMEQLKPEAK